KILGPLCLYSTGLGDCQHVLQKRFASQTNHKHATMDRDILKANLLLMAYYWQNATVEDQDDEAKSRTSNAKSEHSFYGSTNNQCNIEITTQQPTYMKKANIHISGTLQRGLVHNCMWLCGHFIKPGMSVKLKQRPNNIEDMRGP